MIINAAYKAVFHFRKISAENKMCMPIRTTLLSTHEYFHFSGKFSKVENSARNKLICDIYTFFDKVHITCIFHDGIAK